MKQCIISIKSWLSVINALMWREALRKHGHHQLGFFWMIGEPMALIAGIAVLWTMLHISHNAEVDVISFALTGYSFITLWRHISGQSVHIFRNNLNMLYHRRLKLLDVLIAKACIETICLFTAFIVSYLPLSLMGFSPYMHDPLALVGGFVFTGLFSFGFALILASLSELWEPVHNLIGAIMYISLPLTGGFTMQEWLPEKARIALAWSPLVNCIEMIRGGLFPSEIPTHWSASYLVVSCSIICCLGILFYRSIEKSITD